MCKQKTKYKQKKGVAFFSREFLAGHRLNIINAAILLIAFVLILILNLHTGYVSDDFKYRFVFTTMGKPTSETKPISSIVDVIVSMMNHWKLCNGRLVAHGLLQSILPFGEVFFDIFNSLMYIALGFLIYCHSVFKKKDKPWLLALIFTAMWFFLPQFGLTVLWASGAANYLWCAVIILLYILPYRMYAADKNDVKNSTKNLVLMSVFGLFAGCTNENTGGGLVLICIMFIIYYKIIGVKIPQWSIAGAVSTAIGAFVLVSAPGNYRISAKTDLAELINRFKNVFDISARLTYILLFIIAVAIILNLIDRSSDIRANKKISVPIIYCIASYAMMFVLIFAALRPERAWFTAVVLQITAAAILVSELRFIRLNMIVQKSIRYTVTLLAVIAFISSFSTEFKDINSTYAQVKEGVDLIEQAVENDDDSVTIPIPVPSDSKYDAFNGAGYVKEPANDWMNAWMAEYYGIGSISGKQQ